MSSGEKIAPALQQDNNHLRFALGRAAPSASNTSMATAKKSTAKKASKKKPSSAQHCWPGFKPVSGKSAGEKGSCKPKKKQTKAQKEGDRKAAAATKG